ncbi:MAG: hypothetical protein K0S71_2710 [Clostridia bacterium]|nr:hypothetical protein [Clostridia bacterium]
MKTTYDKTVVPAYIEHFSCIGGACEDTCCAGWYIPIDEVTYKKYKKVKDNVFRRRLDREIVAKRSNPTYDHAAKIKLKNGRCAFLSEKGLCDIYSTLGERYLSDTCTLYPRTINRINDSLECSLICSCPEAARKILLNKDKMTFTHIKGQERENTISAHICISPNKPQKWQDYFLELRHFIIDVLQNRNYSIEERFMLLNVFMNDLEKFLTFPLIKKIPEFIKDYHETIQKQKTYRSLNDSTYDTKWYISIAKELKSLKTNKKIKSKRYEECLDSMLLGLDLLKEDNLKLSCVKYEEGNQKYYAKFLSEKEYILENYFVNYVFERCIPLDDNRPSKSFKRMNLYYHLIKLHLVGIANNSQELTEMQTVKLIQSLSKTFDHDDESFAGLMTFTEDNR